MRRQFVPLPVNELAGEYQYQKHAADGVVRAATGFRRVRGFRLPGKRPFGWRVRQARGFTVRPWCRIEIRLGFCIRPRFVCRFRGPHEGEPDFMVLLDERIREDVEMQGIGRRCPVR